MHDNDFRKYTEKSSSDNSSDLDELDDNSFINKSSSFTVGESTMDCPMVELSVCCVGVSVVMD
jgi:hypothetical protein